MENKIFNALHTKKFSTEKMSIRFFFCECDYLYEIVLFGFAPSGEDFYTALEVDRGDPNEECEQLIKELRSFYKFLVDRSSEYAFAGGYSEEELDVIFNDIYATKECLEETIKEVGQLIANEKQIKKNHVLDI